MTLSNKGKKRRASARNFPLTSLYFYLTEGCNLACSHCWISPRLDPDGSKYSFLPVKLFAKILDEAIPLGLEKVKLTGGEPLLHPDIQILLDKVYEKNLELIIETNGILCTPEIAENIARQKNPYVSVSLDSVHPETHDRLRGMEGAFRKTTRAIKTLVSFTIPTQIIMSLRRENFDQIEQMITLTENLGAESLKFNFIQPVGRGRSLHTSDLVISVSELIETGKRIESEFEPKTHLQLVYSSPPAFKSLKNFAPNQSGCAVCGISSILGVLAGGEYALCGIGTQNREMIFGHATENTLKEVWQTNTVLQEIRLGLPKKLTGICGRCLMKYNCLGSCIAMNYYRSGSIWSPFWFCEQAEALGIFPQSRRY